MAKNGDTPCPWKEECKDADDIYCCDEYRIKSHGHCFTKGGLFIQKPKEGCKCQED